MSKTSNRLRRGVPYDHGDLGCRSQAREQRAPSPPTGGDGDGTGGSPTGGSASSSAINISLTNVPYVSQYLNPNSNTSRQVVRSKQYCGIASALMVRDKSYKDAQFAPTWHDSYNGYNYFTADQAMKTIDDNLPNGKYGYVYTDRKIDVLANKGLLYINSSLSDNDTNRAAQYNNTVDIMQC